jgi:flagellin-like protein
VSLGNILLVMVILTPVGVLPVWSHARSWGCGNYGIVGIVLLIVIVLLAAGRLPSPPVIGAPHSSERT